ncbi:MAG: DUF1553 domain-containing protein [Pirellulaceae bacterium]|nr:DUF1553 domain-containing protein [Pirellulaceae bacterium]
MKPTHLIILIALASTHVVADDTHAVADDVDFARDVLPVLSNKCFVCHGPDTQDDIVRLDLADAATADLGGYRAVDQQHPDQSHVLLRIHSSDDPMPPADAEKQLTDAERDLISRWIRQGGQYAKHWAFVAPVKSPDHDGSSPAQIDALVQAKLKTKQIDFAAEADRTTLARRAALVLTGLPPEPDQLNQFLADRSDTAYLRYVDQLLASPRFGEHQARYWLDAVRYGDTHGLHLDNRRGIYPYRDWVVNALNDNLPLSDFITWQIAGDLLPNPTLAQRTATGFVRLNPSTGEGGAITEEFQAKNNFDRVETFGTVFLGMSLTCARCHTHKYDPITQTEYYRLMAYFNNTAEPALDGNSYTYGPTARVPANQADWRRWNDLETKREKLLAEFATELASAEKLAEILQYASARSNWKTTNWRISQPLPADAAMPNADIPDVADNEGKNGTATKENESELWSQAGGLPGEISGRAAKGKLPGVGQAVWVLFDVDVPEDQNLLLTFSGGSGSMIFVDNPVEPLVTKENNDRAVIVTLPLQQGRHQIRQKMVGYSGMSALQSEIQHPWDALAKSKQWDNVSKRDRLLMLADPDGPLAQYPQANIAGKIAAQIRELESRFTTTLVAQELSKPRETRLLTRGEYHQPQGDPLDPGILQVALPLPADAPKNRLALADWLTDRDQPLVARVLVNRIWQRVFGQALVRSPEDFGLQGQQPTHPQLLDWLAVELHESNWNLKHLLRLMVTSRTFRQSSAWRGDIDDPENRLLARGPSHRLDAEVLRDVGLWASGLLDPHMGGEGVKPYQPSGMWLAMAHPASNTKTYQRDQGERLYRRSLYVYWKRTSPHPMMTLFDAPDRESSCVRRSRTSTALQSLAMLNETQRIEIARKLASRLIRQHGTDSERLTQLFKLLSCREPNDAETTACMNLLAEMKKRYAASPQDAEQLLSIGEAASDHEQDGASLDPVEQAAWTQVAATVLASDVAILLY